VRITTGMYYKNMYVNNNRVNEGLFDVNKQIASGLQIQYAYEDTDTFVKTMKLDDEITTFNHVKSSVESGLKFSEQTDSTIGDIIDALDSFKVKVVQAASDVHSDQSIEAIASELSVLRDHLLNLANTSINGQYLFSGTATDVKPFGDDGSYNGNSGELSALLGYDVFQQYNVTGSDLFFGEETQTQRNITMNIPQMSKTELYPDIMKIDSIPRNDAQEVYIDEGSTIRDLVGDVNSQADIDSGAAAYATTYFYVRGTQSDGTAFKEKIAMNGDASVASLLDQIGEAFGNTPTNKVVDVSVNANGQIEVKDKLEGSSKLDFHMVAATDFDPLNDANGDGTANDADVADIDLLDAGESDFEKFLAYRDGTLTPPAGMNTNLLITEFVSSGYDTTSATSIDGITYDRVSFEKNGAVLSGSVPQIVTSDNSFATDATRLVDVASGTTLEGSSFAFEGTDINGNAFSATIDLSNAGSSFTVGGNTYTIYNTGVDPKQPISALNPQSPVAADEMTYRQLMDVMNMVVTGNLPASTSGIDGQGVAADYNAAILAANAVGETSLESDGTLRFEETAATATQASFSLYDAASNDFTAAASAMTFNANNALTISDPKTDFFARLDEIITAVSENKMRSDATYGDARNGGIQNGIQMIDDILNHVVRMQSQSGVQTQSLSMTRDRTEMLIVSAVSLRSEVIDTDLAEASLRLQQLNINMQAIYATTSQISKLSLVNYL